ncbi:MAG: right-handed parallel beta-helix repeat-containing protein [Myxococcota bacterium]
MSSLRVVLSVFSVALFACGESRSSPDGDVSTVLDADAGPGDAGQPDAGLTDAGAPGEPPSCAPTMAWKPRVFTGATYFVRPGASPGGAGTEEDPWLGLQHALDEAPDGAVLFLSEGTFEAAPRAYEDPSCGNCSPATQRAVPATVGFVLTGKSLALVGAGEGRTVLKTNAGYGFLVEDACEVALSGVTVTGGVRDPDGAAADGAVVVRRSRLTLQAVSLADNSGLLPGGGYPGIAGLMLREGADVLVMDSRIERNSWDGVTVFDDGRLRLYGSRVSQGNGVGVGVTWSGRALLVNNDISAYWKGIGSFVNAHVEARNNVVHHHLGWGVWVTQNARLDIVNNTIAYNDLLGVSLSGPNVTGTFVNNLVAFNGLFQRRAYPANTFGAQAGVRGDKPASSAFSPAFNVLFGNRTQDWVLADGVTVLSAADLGSNRFVDPRLVSELDLRLSPGSPAIDSGDPAILDLDGTRSDVGAQGGPDAQRRGP